MQNKLIILGIAVSVAATAHVEAAPGDVSAPQQGLLSRLRQRSTNQAEPVATSAEQRQVAQGRGYQPGVTFPQQQQQQQQQPAPQPQPYPAFPPQQGQPAQPAPGARPIYPGGPQAAPRAATPAPGISQPVVGATPRSSESSNSTGNSSRQSGSSSKSTDSDSSSRSSRPSSSSSSSSSKKSSSSSSKSDSDSNSSSASKSESESSKPKSTKSDSPSALEKIAKKVDSSDTDEESPKKAEKTPEPKKSDDEIAQEKAHAAFLKAADEATTVVASFLKQANDGYYSKASDSLAPALQKYFSSEMSAVNGTAKTVFDELTANGTINMVTYINTTVRGEGAVVDAELGYADGRITRRSFDLIKIDGKWKIVLAVGAPAAAPVAASQAQAAATPAPAAATPAPATGAPLTAEQAAAQAMTNNAPMVLAPGVDAATTSPQP